MPAFLMRAFLCLCLPLALTACDVGRSDLNEDPPVENDGPPPGGPLEGSCSALVDGEPFTAAVASASVSPEGTLNMTCESGLVQFLFRLQLDGPGPATIPLGVSGNQVQYRVGEDVTVTVYLPGGEDVSEVVLTTYTQYRLIGTFRFSVPGFDEGALIGVTNGEFNIELSREPGS